MPRRSNFKSSAAGATMHNTIIVITENSLSAVTCVLRRSVINKEKLAGDASLTRLADFHIQQDVSGALHYAMGVKWTELMTLNAESRFGLAVRRQAGKQRDLGSNPLQLSFLFRSCDLWALS